MVPPLLRGVGGARECQGKHQEGEGNAHGSSMGKEIVESRVVGDGVDLSPGWCWIFSYRGMLLVPDQEGVGKKECGLTRTEQVCNAEVRRDVVCASRTVLCWLQKGRE